MAPPPRRLTLASRYRALDEREIRLRLAGTLTDAERVTAQAELARRGVAVVPAPIAPPAPGPARELLDDGATHDGERGADGVGSSLRWAAGWMATLVASVAAGGVAFRAVNAWEHVDPARSLTVFPNAVLALLAALAVPVLVRLVRARGARVAWTCAALLGVLVACAAGVGVVSMLLCVLQQDCH